MSVRPAGSSIDVNEEQPLKAPSPRLVRRIRCCSSIDLNEEQPLKAPSPRLVRPAGSLIDLNEEQSRKAPSPRLVRRIRCCSSIDINEVHLMKADSPRLVRLVGSWIDINEVHLVKANLPMLVRPSGKWIEVSMDVFPMNAYAGTRASPWRSAHAASSMCSFSLASIHRMGNPHLRVQVMHARTSSIGYESGPEDATHFSLATFTSKPFNAHVTFARLGSASDASTASGMRV